MAASASLALRAAAELELRKRGGGVRLALAPPPLPPGLRDEDLHPPQLEALYSPATEILFGGAAGPGKSHFLRVLAARLAHEIPGLQVYLFRRKLPDLIKNHMDGPGGFPNLLGPWIDSGYARINWGDHFITIGKRSKIHLCHCQHEKDKYNYHGAEIHVLLPDELTTFTDSIYRYLRGRVRIINLDIPERLQGRLPLVAAGSNPGNIGHNWVKAMFIDPAAPKTIWKTEKEEGGMLRQFLPARLEDNATMGEKERTEYTERLEGLGDPALVRAMVDGDWDIVAGGMFDDLWNAKTKQHHLLSAELLPPAAVPRTWPIDRSMDWGSSKPFAIAWWAESDGTEATLADGTKWSRPRGTLIRLGELYGWNGKPNEGCRQGPAEVAKRVKAAEKLMGIEGRVRPGPADPAIFDVEDGESIGAKFALAGVRWEAADKSPGSRKNGAEDIRERLKANISKEGKGLIFLDTNRHGIRLLPTLARDSNKPDDVDTDAEDHDYDMTRYRCMFKRKAGGSGHLPLPS